MCLVAQRRLLLLLALIHVSRTTTTIASESFHSSSLEVRHNKNVRVHKPEAEIVLNPSSNFLDNFSAHRVQPAPVDNNGSAIYEDLVKQILEKHRESVGAQNVDGPGDQTLDLEVRSQHHGTPVERSSGELLMGAESLVDANAAQVFGTSNTSQPNQAEVDELATAGAPLVVEHQELDDRHIQYDTEQHTSGRQVELLQHQKQQTPQPNEQQLYTSLKLDTGGGRHLADYRLAVAITNDANINNGTKEDLSLPTTLREPPNKQDKILPIDNQADRLNTSTSVGPNNELPPVTLNSTNVVDVVAPNPLSTSDLSSQMTVANVTGRSLSGGGGIQARSMHSNSVSKAPQHTRPPYATHDQFSHKSGPLDLAQDSAVSTTASSVPLNQHLKSNSSSLETNNFGGATQLMASASEPIASRSSDHQSLRQPQSSDSMQRQQTDENKLHKLANSQLVELSPMPASAGAGGGGNRENLITGERSHFSKESSLFGGLTAPNRAHNNDRYSAGANANEQQQQQQQTYDQPANTFNDLSGAGGGFYLSAKSNLLEQQVADQDSKNEAPESQRSVHEFIRGPSTHAPSLDYGSRYQQLQQQQQQQQQLEAAESQQIPTSGLDITPSSNVKRHTADHLQVGPSGALLMMHRTAQPTHYAASLLNVTAPMVLPLSATEAMESDLGGGQAAKSLLHQVSGLLRPGSSSNPTSQGIIDPVTSGRAQINATGRQPSSSYQHQHQHQHPVAQYYTAGSPMTVDPIYSPPANQFNPPKQSQANILMDPLDLNSSASLSNLEKERMRLDGSGFFSSHRRPQVAAYHLPQSHSVSNLSQVQHQASGFRSPALSQSHLLASSSGAASLWASTSLPLPSSYLGGSLSPSSTGAAAAAAAVATAPQQAPQQAPGLPTSPQVNTGSQMPQNSSSSQQQQQQQQTPRPPAQSPSLASTGSSTNSSTSVATSTTNGFITGATSTNGPANGAVIPSDPTGSAGLNRRVFNLTRVEHISAECSNDLIRTVIVFNGTFRGIIYSSGYVRDPNCLYINGTGKTRYDFSIRLNQCGTLGRQELHPPAGPNEVRRRDQVMWNTLSIQYNPIIEQEWDEHFRVSCEYGSDFWKTVSFSPFNVETNTGAPVVFTVDPPQCQMEILRGHGMVGPRQEAFTGTVTVGDPLTLLIHMKSEKAGYDILVKNCIAHNGGHQKMQLIDSNGCVVNERFISPFRGTYNDNDLKHVTLYSYLKAFRFTGSPVLYLECEIHMCQSSCPPQMCYWRHLSKRSATNESLSSLIDNSPEMDDDDDDELNSFHETTTAIYHQQSTSPAPRASRRRGRQMSSGAKFKSSEPKSMNASTGGGGGQISDKVNLFQSLVVEERHPNVAPYSLASESDGRSIVKGDSGEQVNSDRPPMCYRRAEVLAFLFTAVALLLVALSVTVGCCWRAANMRHQDGKRLAASLISANVPSPLSPPLSCGSGSSSSSSSSSLSSYSGNANLSLKQQTCHEVHNEMQQTASQNFIQSSAHYRKPLNAHIHPIMIQSNHSKQRHKECLISPSY